MITIIHDLTNGDNVTIYDQEINISVITKEELQFTINVDNNFSVNDLLLLRINNKFLVHGFLTAIDNNVFHIKTITNFFNEDFVLPYHNEDGDYNNSLLPSVAFKMFFDTFLKNYFEPYIKKYWLEINFNFLNEYNGPGFNTNKFSNFSEYYIFCVSNYETKITSSQEYPNGNTIIDITIDFSKYHTINKTMNIIPNSSIIVTDFYKPFDAVGLHFYDEKRNEIIASIGMTEDNQLTNNSTKWKQGIFKLYYNKELVDSDGILEITKYEAENEAYKLNIQDNEERIKKLDEETDKAEIEALTAENNNFNSLINCNELLINGVKDAGFQNESEAEEILKQELMKNIYQTTFEFECDYNDWFLNEELEDSKIYSDLGLFKTLNVMFNQKQGNKYKKIQLETKVTSITFMANNRLKIRCGFFNDEDIFKFIKAN